jgi:hypothetical protein
MKKRALFVQYGVHSVTKKHLASIIGTFRASFDGNVSRCAQWIHLAQAALAPTGRTRSADVQENNDAHVTVAERAA